MKTAALLILALACPAAAQAAGDAQAGKTVFASKCASCHSVGPSARAAFGPQLNGIYGRVAGATADYKYSPEMKKSGVVWSETTLSAFIRSPGKVVPGNRMRFWGISNERQI